MTEDAKTPFYKKPIFIIIMIFIVLALFAGSRWRHHGYDGYHGYERYHPGFDSERMVERISDDLELTAVQQDKLQQLSDYVRDNRPKRDWEFDAMRQQWDELLTAETFDRSAFDQQWSELDSVMTQKMQSYGVFIDGLSGEVAAFLESLDANQRAEVSEKLQRFERYGRHGRYHR